MKYSVVVDPGAELLIKQDAKPFDNASNIVWYVRIYYSGVPKPREAAEDSSGHVTIDADELKSVVGIELVWVAKSLPDSPQIYGTASFEQNGRAVPVKSSQNHTDVRTALKHLFNSTSVSVLKK